MAYSVNVDLETLNTPGGDPNCRAHPGRGPHYDITVHPPGCPHQQRQRARRPQRYWRDLQTEDAAVDFASSTDGRPTLLPPRARATLPFEGVSPGHSGRVPR
jgi:hypothetical protein